MSAARTLRFALNSHGPGVDRYSMLCVRSIRRACGPEAGILVFTPTNLEAPSSSALRLFDRMDVEVRSFRNEFLPERVTDPASVPARHMTLNKLYCFDDLEPGERRVFVDWDTVFLEDPRPLLLSFPDPVGCCPIDTPESFLGDWRRLYDELGAPFPDERIEVWETYAYRGAPEPERTEMVPYFSSGVLCVDEGSDLPEVWRETCRQLEARIDLLPRSFFLDQVALSVAVRRSGTAWRLLPRSLNCTFEIWRFVGRPLIFHYVLLDTLAAGVARFPRLRKVCRELVGELAREDGLDLRLQVLTQWPRWYRRLVGLGANLSGRLTGLRIGGGRERT